MGFFSRKVNAAKAIDPWGFGYPFTLDPALGGATLTWPAANQARYVRCLGAGTISKIGIHVMTTSADTICVGVYRNSGSGRSSVPGVRIATSGSVASPSTGYAEVALGASVAVAAGDWLAFSQSGTTTAIRGNTAATLQSNLGDARLHQGNTAHPLPDPATVGSGNTGCVPLLIGVA